MKIIIILMFASLSLFAANDKVTCNISVIENNEARDLLELKLDGKKRLASFEDRSLELVVNFLYKMNGDVQIVIKDNDSNKTKIGKTLKLSRNSSGALNISAGWDKRLDIFCKR